KLAERGDAYALVVEDRPLPLLGPEGVVLDGVVDDAGDEAAAGLQGDRRAAMGNAVQEGGGAIERVEDPAEGAVRGGLGAALFHEEPVAGPGAGKLLANCALGARVRDGDELAGSLHRHLELFDLVEVAQQPAPRLLGGAEHHGDVGGGTGHLSPWLARRRTG